MPKNITRIAQLEDECKKLGINLSAGRLGPRGNTGYQLTFKVSDQEVRANFFNLNEADLFLQFYRKQKKSST